MFKSWSYVIMRVLNFIALGFLMTVGYFIYAPMFTPRPELECELMIDRGRGDRVYVSVYRSGDLLMIQDEVMKKILDVQKSILDQGYRQYKCLRDEVQVATSCIENFNEKKSAVIFCFNNNASPHDRMDVLFDGDAQCWYGSLQNRGNDGLLSDYIKPKLSEIIPNADGSYFVWMSNGDGRRIRVKMKLA